jgi:hypothetical protein
VLDDRGLAVRKGDESHRVRCNGLLPRPHPPPSGASRGAG